METFPDEAMSRLLADMQQEVEHFILKMTSVLSGRKNQLIFLINNYDLILSILSVSHLPNAMQKPCELTPILKERSRSESKESDSFKDLLHTRISEYVEQVLFPHFGNLIKFIQRAELLTSSVDGNRALDHEAENVSVLIRNFNGGWKNSLDEINREVLGSFPNFKNGTSILQQALTMFVQYYHRFHKILSHQTFSEHPDRNQLINVHQLMVEVKKYKPNF